MDVAAGNGTRTTILSDAAEALDVVCGTDVADVADVAYVADATPSGGGDDICLARRRHSDSVFHIFTTHGDTRHNVGNVSRRKS